MSAPRATNQENSKHASKIITSDDQENKNADEIKHVVAPATVILTAAQTGSDPHMNGQQPSESAHIPAH